MIWVLGTEGLQARGGRGREMHIIICQGIAKMVLEIKEAKRRIHHETAIFNGIPVYFLSIQLHLYLHPGISRSVFMALF